MVSDGDTLLFFKCKCMTQHKKDTFSASADNLDHLFLHRVLLDGTMTSLELSPDEVYSLIGFMTSIPQYQRRMLAELELAGVARPNHIS